MIKIILGVYFAILACIVAFASDDVRVQKNTGIAYVVPSATPTNYAPLMVGYTTDGNGHLQILVPGGGSVDDDLVFPKNTGKMYLDKGSGNLYPASVIYTTDGNGHLQPVSLGSGATSPGGSNTQVQFNNSGSFGGAAAFAWDGTSVKLNSLANVSGTKYFNLGSGTLLYQNGQTAFDLVNSIIKTSGGNASIYPDSCAVAYPNTGSTVFSWLNNYLDMNSHKIANVTDPASAQDAATKNYVDTHSPQGTVCGWYDTVGTALIVSCQGSDPNSSCPSGYTQKTTTGAKFCAAN